MFTVETIDPTVGSGFVGLKEKCKLNEIEYDYILEVYSSKHLLKAETISNICLVAYTRKHRKSRKKFYLNFMLCKDINQHFNIKNNSHDKALKLNSLFGAVEKVLSNSECNLSYNQILVLLANNVVTKNDVFLTKEHYDKFLLDCSKRDTTQICDYSYTVYDIVRNVLKGLKADGIIEYSLIDILNEI
jgi:hypothetical protein